MPWHKSHATHARHRDAYFLHGGSGKLGDNWSKPYCHHYGPFNGQKHGHFSGHLKAMGTYNRHGRDMVLQYCWGWFMCILRCWSLQCIRGFEDIWWLRSVLFDISSQESSKSYQHCENTHQRNYKRIQFHYYAGRWTWNLPKICSFSTHLTTTAIPP